MEQDPRIGVEVIEKSLAKKFDVPESQVEVQEWSTKPGIPDGQNFACDIVSLTGKAKMQGESKEFHFMTKVTTNEQPLSGV